MNIKVIKDKCIGCGSCVIETENRIFDFDENGQATAINVEEETLTEEDLKHLETAINFCPTNAIIKEENNEL